MSKPTVEELVEHLRKLVHWEQVAIHLPGIYRSNIEKIKKDSSKTGNETDDQKQILFDRWLRIHPDASWENVIMALRKAEENALAESLRRKFNFASSEDVESWKEKYVVKDEELSKTRAELCDALTDKKRKEELIFSLKKEIEESNATLKSSVSKIQQVTQKFQEVAPLQFWNDKTDKPVKTITGLKSPWGMAVCKNGDIVVIEYSAKQQYYCVTIVNKEGMKVGSFGTEEKNMHLVALSGAAITNDGCHILVTDNHRLIKLTFDGAYVKTVGSSESGSGQLQFNHPRGITVHPTTGQVFVADRSNDRIQVFTSSDLTYVRSITLIHDDYKQFSNPYDVSFDSAGFMYIAEYGNHCITKLTTTGQYITRFGCHGSAPGQLDTPTSLTINSNLVYVCDRGNHRVSVFDTKGKFLHCFGKRGSGEREFDKPYGISKDILCNLYITDTWNGRIVVF